MFQPPEIVSLVATGMRYGLRAMEAAVVAREPATAELPLLRETALRGFRYGAIFGSEITPNSLPALLGLVGNIPPLSLAEEPFQTLQNDSQALRDTLHGLFDCLPWGSDAMVTGRRLTFEPLPHPINQANMRLAVLQLTLREVANIAYLMTKAVPSALDQETHRVLLRASECALKVFAGTHTPWRLHDFMDSLFQGLPILEKDPVNGNALLSAFLNRTRKTLQFNTTRAVAVFHGQSPATNIPPIPLPNPTPQFPQSRASSQQRTRRTVPTSSATPSTPPPTRASTTPAPARTASSLTFSQLLATLADRWHIASGQIWKQFTQDSRVRAIQEHAKLEIVNDQGSSLTLLWQKRGGESFSLRLELGFLDSKSNTGPFAKLTVS